MEYNNEPIKQGVTQTEEQPILNSRQTTPMGSVRDHTTILIGTDTPANEQPVPVKKRENIFTRIIHTLDAYQVEETPPTALGGFLTFAILPATVVYSVILLYTMLQAPKPIQNEIIWSSMGGPFPMKIRCVAEGGCKVSNAFPDRNLHDCWPLSQGEEMEVGLDYANEPEWGVSVLATMANNKKPVVMVMSEVHNPESEKADEDGTVQVWIATRPGMTLYNYVHTTNYTQHNSGRKRKEFFGSWVDREGSVEASATACQVDNYANYVQARLRMQPSWNDIKVNEAFSWMEWFSLSCGWYAAMISWGAIVLWFWEHYQSAVKKAAKAK